MPAGQARRGAGWQVGCEGPLVVRQVQEMGLTVDDLIDKLTSNRISIKTAVGGTMPIIPDCAFRDVSLVLRHGENLKKKAFPQFQ
jgi:hypothetical protein